MARLGNPDLIVAAIPLPTPSGWYRKQAALLSLARAFNKSSRGVRENPQRGLPMARLGCVRKSQQAALLSLARAFNTSSRGVRENPQRGFNTSSRGFASANQ
ncbi:MAG: hypothetical protein LUC86_00345, partial [Prevotellaceae bacterium]|nr:hypothetical protein [Prevotellaceae bacterium]